MSFIYCQLNIHANLLRPWRFPLIQQKKKILENYFKNVSCALNLISTFLLLNISSSFFESQIHFQAIKRNNILNISTFLLRKSNLLFSVDV
jgi:hypothetical protein